MRRLCTYRPVWNGYLPEEACRRFMTMDRGEKDSRVGLGTITRRVRDWRAPGGLTDQEHQYEAVLIPFNGSQALVYDINMGDAHRQEIVIRKPIP